jgi:hypothetical protein
MMNDELKSANAFLFSLIHHSAFIIHHCHYVFSFFFHTSAGAFGEGAAGAARAGA